MQSDFFDKKIKDAADHHHPSYDEQAWKRMLKLLDRHLPQQPENRRKFLFILLFLFLGGGGWLLISQPWKNNSQVSQATTEAIITSPANKKDQKSESVVPVEETNATTTVTVPAKTIDRSTESNPVSGANLLRNRERRTDRLTAALTKQQIKTNNPSVTEKEFPNKDLSDKTTEPSKNEQASVPFPPVKVNKPETPINNDRVVTRPVTEYNTMKQEDKKNDPVTPDIKTAKKKKDNSKMPGAFFLSFSAGPDISFTELNDWGNIRLAAGVGAGYTFRDRLTIRTGFYTGRKIYSASPKEYNPPPEFWAYYPYLQKVDANCKVYEIPLTLSYNFNMSPKKEWFVSGGVSTYLMKEEAYNYTYKYTPTGPSYNRKMTFENKNNHFLSVLTLSGGYKRNLSKRVFLSAEPYLKLPMSGVGYGKVKLNSGGMLFTVGVKPFNTKNPSPAQR